MFRNHKHNLLLIPIPPLAVLAGISLCALSNAIRQEQARQANDKALVTAVERNDTRTALSLLREGANPDAKHIFFSRRPRSLWGNLRAYLQTLRGKRRPEEEIGQTMLELAMLNNNVAIVEALLDRGASNMDVYLIREPPVRWAAQHKRWDLVRKMARRGAKVTVSNGCCGGGSLLTDVIRENDLEGVRTLLKVGFDPNKDFRDGPALCFAVMFGREEATRLLVEHGARVDQGFEEGYTPLMEAVTIHPGAIDTVVILLDHAAKIDATNRDGDTALVYAAECGNVNVVKLLLNRGADINHQNKQGCTALMLAASYADEKTIQLLLQRGANVNVQNHKGQTAMKNARKRKHQGIIRLLQRAGAKQ
jgi:ankyrin repeat protein